MKGPQFSGVPVYLTREHPMLLAGIDLAWQSERNTSGIAFGILSSGLELREVGIADSLADVQIQLTQQVDLRGVAIDAPLIIRNLTGQRLCEREIGRVYGSRKASCHTSNLSIYPSAASVALSKSLLQRGFGHLNSDRWQIEVYPHPAIIEIFGLSERLLYKKGNVDVRRQGQIALARMLNSLSTSDALPLIIPEGLQIYLSERYILSLKGKALKANEDLLDAIVCLYIAGLYVLDPTCKVFGDNQDGYVYVPQRLCV